jgi:hypothetical protein
MPLKLKDINNESEVVLDVIKYNSDEGLKYFRVYNSENESIGINIKFIPTSDSDWDKERFELVIFENSYLNAENDVFEVYENTLLGERLGWIFPITILESNENDFTNKKNLNNYKFIAYQKILERDVTILKKENTYDFYSLSEIFRESIICLLSKDTIAKIPGFNIENYLLSFFGYGYLILNEYSKSKSIYDKTSFQNEMRKDRSRVILKKSNFDINTDFFIKSLFKDHLLQSENYLIRFVFLYQIIEYFMDLEFNNQFDNCIEDYKKNDIAKNDLKESILSVSKERFLIKKVINRILLSTSLKDEFIQECNFLFEDIGFKSNKDNLSDKIYDLRNILTHRLRELTSKTKSLEKITEIFERLILEMLINYNAEDDVLEAEKVNGTNTKPNSIKLIKPELNDISQTKPNKGVFLDDVIILLLFLIIVFLICYE